MDPGNLHKLPKLNAARDLALREGSLIQVEGSSRYWRLTLQPPTAADCSPLLGSAMDISGGQVQDGCIDYCWDPVTFLWRYQAHRLSMQSVR